MKDNGIGIEPGSIDKVFDAFEQADSNITRQFGGLGIGLSITKGLVLLHNGTITVTSEGRNKGSMFSVVLPVVQTPIFKQVLPANTTETDGTPKKILLVEDNKSTLLVMNRMIKKLGHTVITAMSIKEGKVSIF